MKLLLIPALNCYLFFASHFPFLPFRCCSLVATFSSWRFVCYPTSLPRLLFSTTSYFREICYLFPFVATEAGYRVDER